MQTSRQTCVGLGQGLVPDIYRAGSRGNVSLTDIGTNRRKLDWNSKWRVENILKFTSYI